jgi:hypothetical protein
LLGFIGSLDKKAACNKEKISSLRSIELRLLLAVTSCSTGMLVVIENASYFSDACYENCIFENAMKFFSPCFL